MDLIWKVWMAPLILPSLGSGAVLFVEWLMHQVDFPGLCPLSRGNGSVFHLKNLEGCGVPITRDTGLIFAIKYHSIWTTLEENRWLSWTNLQEDEQGWGNNRSLLLHDWTCPSLKVVCKMFLLRTRMLQIILFKLHCWCCWWFRYFGFALHFTLVPQTMNWISVPTA